MSDPVLDALESAGQQRLADSIRALPREQADALLLQVASIDLPLVERLVRELVREPADAAAGSIGPAEVDRRPADDTSRAHRHQAFEAGEQALREGRVAVVLLAGGQGTRLGFDHPKGMFPIGPVSNASLFEVHAAGMGATRRRYGCDLPFLLMTSDVNDAETRAFFDEHLLFGLQPESVTTFVQGMLPAVDPATGDILREAPDRLALSPDGHGGIFRAMGHAAILGDLEERGIDVIMTFQVDNPLMRPADPEFIGAHLLARAEMSTLVVAKVAPEERMGVMASVDGRTALVEYTDLPAELEAARDEAGDLLYWAGSTGVHCLDRAFATRLATGEAPLPFHRADKRVATVDDPDPQVPNAVKFEAFMFDALPLAARTATVEMAREECFAPVKNADGADSPATCRAAMVDRAARWLEAQGAAVPRGADGASQFPIEIDPRFAQDAADLRGRIPSDFAVDAPLLLRN
ncbi:MAG: UTP--glucose-1-phosphate uridylyltransferase [Acidobacteria bacterium]|nr:UTP--glucose-1-phosphate uridylyltransferase [Acidobacteriota bacterium]